MTARPPRISLRPVAALAAWLSLAACGGDATSSGPPVQPPPAGRPALPQTYRPSGHAAAGDVFVHLFEWKWTDVARECRDVLGPAGVKAVQISPPQEHSVQSSHTWSQRYQPVSYSVERSRSGTGAEFAAMLDGCGAAGVDVYVDAVINHMTNVPDPGVGSAGTSYTKYAYPGLYTQADFHTPCAISSYQVAAQVQDCELFGLPDLNTGSASVRAKIAEYLVRLSRMGVDGFRIDAAKHIQPTELDSIIGLVERTLVGEGRPRPYWFAEVIDYGGEAVTERDYFGLAYRSGGAADVTEFTFKGVADKFTRQGTQRISELNPNGPAGAQFSPAAWGMMPADKAVVFLQNHDTQREGGTGWHDGDVFRLANVWMLAQPYGYPSIMSGYAFARGTQAGREMGPPSDAAGRTNDVSCAPSWEEAEVGDWVCEHRDPSILRMVPFRRAVAGTDITGWWDNGAHAIAFSRGAKGFVAINRGDAPVAATVSTPLPPGTYCDVLTGGRAGAACAGTAVVVSPAGTVDVALQPNRAVAVHLGTRL